MIFSEIYVDEPFVAYAGPLEGKMVCHLFTVPGNNEALHEIALLMGLKRKWYQNYDLSLRSMSHYDITEPLRNKAIALGAIEVNRQIVSDMLSAHRIHLAKLEESND